MHIVKAVFANQQLQILEILHFHNMYRGILIMPSQESLPALRRV